MTTSTAANTAFSNSLNILKPLKITKVYHKSTEYFAAQQSSNTINSLEIKPTNCLLTMFGVQNTHNSTSNQNFQQKAIEIASTLHKITDSKIQEAWWEIIAYFSSIEQRSATTFLIGRGHEQLILDVSKNELSYISAMYNEKQEHFIQNKSQLGKARISSCIKTVDTFTCIVKHGVRRYQEKLQLVMTIPSINNCNTSEKIMQIFYLPQHHVLVLLPAKVDERLQGRTFAADYSDIRIVINFITDNIAVAKELFAAALALKDTELVTI